MDTISNRFYEGERPLYGSKNLKLDNVKFYPGESALKEAANIEADNCTFMCKYPFWHNDNSIIKNSLFTVYSRAAIWHSKNIRMIDSVVEAPKMFREVDGIELENVKFPNAGETLWSCRNIKIKNVEAKEAPYIFMNCVNIEIEGFKLQGDYSFDGAKNIVIKNAYLDSKDAFWKTENVTVYNSVIIGEYLGWHSKNLRLVNCKIGGEQPFCYCTDLVLENCEFMDDCNLSFEYSSVNAEITNHIISVKNPLSGVIKAKSIGEIILDENYRNPGACEIIETGECVTEECDAI
ncbi:DUF3737 family protein [Chryseobacterium sp. KMC2]|uniref:DUF3737 family protein n=1 Tax=Chryseobacterium sp. KMC2 TaxID=2800705 RepID=UPI00192305E7|nr:DUF3737 family protein [Chryseobacterium sp. KMC2]MBL3547256.1 DUF3737 family protein [Chryseobacterium sp. KMC2]